MRNSLAPSSCLAVCCRGRAVLCTVRECGGVQVGEGKNNIPPLPPPPLYGLTLWAWAVPALGRKCFSWLACPSSRPLLPCQTFRSLGEEWEWVGKVDKGKEQVGCAFCRNNWETKVYFEDIVKVFFKKKQNRMHSISILRAIDAGA